MGATSPYGMIDWSNWLDCSLSLSFSLCLSSTPSGIEQDKIVLPLSFLCLFGGYCFSDTSQLSVAKRHGWYSNKLAVFPVFLLYLVFFFTLLKTLAWSEGAVGVWLLSWALMWVAVRSLQRLESEVCSLSSCPTRFISQYIGWES